MSKPRWPMLPTCPHYIAACDAVRLLMRYMGEDPDRDGLKDTPARVVKAMREMTAGYELDPAEILGKRFAEKYDEMVIVPGIEFTSLCEHHLLPFTGTAAVGYLPNPNYVVGLSKIPKVVTMYAKRLQVQERMTQQIADAIEKHCGALGVAVVIEAKHLCMCGRGVNQPRASMVTSCLRGSAKTSPDARAELLALIRGR